ncbi:NAD(P)-dependent oxidoreductase [Nocardia sp. BMG51109]|uniref:NAD(P)-dependent oxidoreductase n=1 Tax=Nocardia sp. BMG51109 TaxID=1056816 RepID=UPI001E354EA8|nr:NAD(P)-dependent oxidoreductase [Nocardia sp. BMG51109]
MPGVLADAGGRRAGSIAEAVRDAEVVVTMLPNHPEVERVVLGDDGVFAHAPEGALLIDFSTIRPASSVALAEAGAERGFRVLDAPVSGGQAGAEQGVLSIMVGGNEADFDSATPIFEAVGKTYRHVGGTREHEPACAGRLPDEAQPRSAGCTAAYALTEYPAPRAGCRRIACPSRRTDRRGVSAGHRPHPTAATGTPAATAESGPAARRWHSLR